MNKKKKELMLRKFQRSHKNKKKLFKKLNIQRKFYDLRRESIILKYKNLSVFTSIGVFIGYIKEYLSKNRRKYKDRQNYQTGILIETTKTLLFKLFTLQNSIRTNYEPSLTFTFLGYRALFFLFTVRLRQINKYSNMNIRLLLLPKLSYKKDFRRKRVKSIKKRLKKKLKYFY